MRVRPSSDHGFTLIELLVAVTITGFIAAAIGGAFLAFMTNQERAGDQQAIARDQFSLSSWFLADAQSSTAADTGDTASDSSVCASGVPLEAVDTNRNVVQLTWSDGPGGSGTDYEANYRAERDSLSDPWRLVRYFCESGDPASEVTVVQELLVSPSPTFSANRGRLTLQLTSGFDPAIVLVAVGTRHTVVVPDVSGLDPSEAAQAIAEAGLTPATKQVPSDTVPVGDLVGQDPAPLTTLGLGSPVTLNVSSGVFTCAFGTFSPDMVVVTGTTLDAGQSAAIALVGDCDAVTSVQLFVDKNGNDSFAEAGEDHGPMTMDGDPQHWTSPLTSAGWIEGATIDVQIVMSSDDGELGTSDATTETQ